MAVELRFHAQRVGGDADLALGEVRPSWPRSLAADLVWPEATLEASIGNLALVGADLAWPDAVVEGDFSYRADVLRGPRGGVAAGHGAALAVPLARASGWNAGMAVRPLAVGPWEAARALPVDQGLGWEAMARLPRQAAPAWEKAVPVPGSGSIPWVALRGRPSARREPWEAGRAVPLAVASPYIYLVRRHDRSSQGWEAGAGRALAVGFVYSPLPPRHRQTRRIPWEEGAHLAALWPRPIVPLPPPPRPAPTADLDFRCPASGGARLPFGRRCPAYPPPRYRIPIRRIYLMLHDVTVTRLGDGYPVRCSRLSLGLDADSWGWTWQATVLGRPSLDAVMPEQNGEPVTLEVQINGHVWHLLAEEWEESRQFGQRGVTVRGRGLNALLAEPFRLVGDGVSDSTMTAAQLADAHLPLGEGWALTWGGLDWLVPAGAWSWQGKSPMGAIHEIAQAVRYRVNPAKTGRALAIVPRYPVLPWNYATATPDLVVPAAATVQITRRQSLPSGIDGVFVHGGSVGGVLAFVRRDGTAGADLAPTQSHPLITHVDAARALGEGILAGYHQQPLVRSLSMPLGGAHPLVEVGHLLRVDLDGAAVWGIASAVSVAVDWSNGVKARQNVTLGEETSNPFNRFKRLTPTARTLMGRIEAVLGGGKVLVSLTGGGTAQAVGEGEIGGMVFVKDGRVAGEAPEMARVEVGV